MPKNNFEISAEVKILRDGILRAVEDDFQQRPRDPRLETATPEETEAAAELLASRKAEIFDLIKAGSRLLAGALMDLQSLAESARIIAQNTSLPVVQVARMEDRPARNEPLATDAAKGLSE